MQLVNNFADIMFLIKEIKRVNGRLVTNFFPNETRTSVWIGQKELFYEPGDECQFFFRRGMGFWYLYFSSTGTEKLNAALEDLKGRLKDIIVVDLVGRSEETESTGKILEYQGFRHYETLVRMSLNRRVRTGPAGSDDEVLFARVEDAVQVHDFLVNRLDKYSEQIATPFELASASAGNQLLLMKNDNDICGLLYFEKTGNTSHLKEWLVDEKSRGMQTGSKLMKKYFSLCSDCTRFILWVKSGNEPAIMKYIHYGYATDNLVDRIFIRNL